MNGSFFGVDWIGNTVGGRSIEVAPTMEVACCNSSGFVEIANKGC